MKTLKQKYYNIKAAYQLGNFLIKNMKDMPDFIVPNYIRKQSSNGTHVIDYITENPRIHKYIVR